MRTASTALSSILCAGLASPAFADNDNNKGHGGGPKVGRRDDHRGRGNDGPTFEWRRALATRVIAGLLGNPGNVAY